MKDIIHQPVLLHEVLHFLKINRGGWYVDATLGSGGHTIEIAHSGGFVLGIDRDQTAISRTQRLIEENFPEVSNKIMLVKANFVDLGEVITDQRIKSIKGFIFDLGVSSDQLNDAERGFSFQNEGELDMRMDRELTVTAKDLVNVLSEAELVEIFVRYGEVYLPKLVAKTIVNSRRQTVISTTTQLRDIVQKSYKQRWKRKINPATQVFQALRIAVNDEMKHLEAGLKIAIDRLSEKGRLIVISFHSIEDRLVKVLFKRSPQVFTLTDKPIQPSAEEIEANPRARSARLRVAEKI